MERCGRGRVIQGRDLGGNIVLGDGRGFSRGLLYLFVCLVGDQLLRVGHVYMD